jgi:hypothetical protein
MQFFQISIKLYFVDVYLSHTLFVVGSFIQRVMFCFHNPAFFMYIHIYGHVYFHIPFLEPKFCSVPSYVFDTLGCAAGEERLRSTA